LETTAAHAKAHGVEVDVVVECIRGGRRKVLMERARRALIAENCSL
jgi:hypothetical protein